MDEATATFLVFVEHELGCEPGLVPGGRFGSGFRLCRDCAASTNAEVTEMGQPAICYVQPLLAAWSA